MTLSSPAASLIHTSDGPVRGTTDGPVSVWKGIPYAAAPIGALRFRGPQKPQPWQEPLDATEFGPCEPQGRNAVIPLGADVRMDEDCLSLNIWSPSGGKANKPVMFWIHGGAYFRGASSQPLFNGRSLAENGDVVVVTINYRIGVFGWVDFSAFSTPEETFESNVALRDMIAALRWVRENIAAFGGDPGQVTVFGESAGAGAVTTLMAVPCAEGLFHRAIAESSPATSVYNLNRASSVASRFLDLLGGGSQALGKLRTLTAAELVEASDALFAAIPAESPGTLAFAPVVDGDLLPEYPVAAFRQGHAHRIPLLIGTNKDESALFKLMKSPLMPIDAPTINSMFAQIARENPERQVPDTQQLEPAYEGLSTQKTGLGITRDFGFRMPTLWIVEGHSRYAPTWLYRFDYAPAALKALGIGATHATELAYVWGGISHSFKDITYKLGGLRTARAVSARMQHRWLAFATAGEPQGLPGEPSWEAYDEQNRSSLVIDSKDRAVNDLDVALRAAWGDDVVAFR